MREEQERSERGVREERERSERGMGDNGVRRIPRPSCEREELVYDVLSVRRSQLARGDPVCAIQRAVTRSVV